MNRELAKRLTLLESRLAASPMAASVEVDAREFARRILSIAERFPDDAAHLPASDRERRFSQAERLAWALRFEGDPEALDAVMAECAARAEQVAV